MVENEDLIVVGAGDSYEARCRRCFEPNPAQAKRENGPQMLTRNRVISGGA
jgi:thymidine kinase